MGEEWKPRTAGPWEGVPLPSQLTEGEVPGGGLAGAGGCRRAHSFALSLSGTSFGWGSNNAGQLALSGNNAPGNGLGL